MIITLISFSKIFGKYFVFVLEHQDLAEETWPNIIGKSDLLLWWWLNQTLANLSIINWSIFRQSQLKKQSTFVLKLTTSGGWVLLIVSLLVSYYSLNTPWNSPLVLFVIVHHSSTLLDHTSTLTYICVVTFLLLTCFEGAFEVVLSFSGESVWNRNPRLFLGARGFPSEIDASFWRTDWGRLSSEPLLTWKKSIKQNVHWPCADYRDPVINLFWLNIWRQIAQIHIISQHSGLFSARCLFRNTKYRAENQFSSPPATASCPSKSQRQTNFSIMESDSPQCYTLSRNSKW